MARKLPKLANQMLILTGSVANWGPFASEVKSTKNYATTCTVITPTALRSPSFTLITFPRPASYIISLIRLDGIRPTSSLFSFPLSLSSAELLFFKSLLLLGFSTSVFVSSHLCQPEGGLELLSLGFQSAQYPERSVWRPLMPPVDRALWTQLRRVPNPLSIHWEKASLVAHLYQRRNSFPV